MALKIDTNQSATAFHITTGATLFPYAVDAQSAISTHPLEWSDMPWTAERAADARARLNERNKEQGNPPIPEPAPLSPADQKALDEHNAAVEAAAKRLADYRKKRDEEDKVAQQVAADEALVASVPPQPDPNARRPLSPAQIRKAAATLSPAEIEEKRARDAADAKQASDAAARKAADDKAAEDRMGNAILATKV